MKTRSVRFLIEDLKKADQLEIDINEACRYGLRRSINIKASLFPIELVSFNKKCSCELVVDEKNGLDLKITEIGLWFLCPSCGSTGLCGSYSLNYKK